MTDNNQNTQVRFVTFFKLPNNIITTDIKIGFHADTNGAIIPFNEHFTAMWDTGATCCCIKLSVAQRL
jgi:hypothetical protein